MRIFIISILSILLVACSKPSKNNTNKKYDFDIQSEIDIQISLLNQNKKYCKSFIKNERSQESIDIDINEIQKVFIGLKEYDINKPALQNTYQTIQTDSSVLYSSKEKTYIKSVSIISNKDTKHIIIEIENNNNLFNLNKRIDWHVNHSLTIHSYKKVKAMEADEFSIHYDLTANCAKAESIDSTGI